MHGNKKGGTPIRPDHKPARQWENPKPAPSERSPEMSKKWKEEILTQIYDVHQQIRSHEKSVKGQTEIKAALEDLKTEILQLTDKLWKHGAGEEIRQAEEKGKKTKEKGKPPQNTTASRTVDLSAAINNFISENVKLKGTVLKCRRDLKAIGDQVLSLGNEKGLNVEKNPDDESEVQKMLEMLQNKNKKMSNHLDNLEKAINAASKEMHDEKSELLSNKSSTTFKPSNISKERKKDISREKREVTNSVNEEQKYNSKSSIVLQAINTINELQAYKREISYQLDNLDKAINAAPKKMDGVKSEPLPKKPSTTFRTLKPPKEDKEKEKSEVTNSIEEEQKSNSKSSVVLQAITTINELQVYKRELSDQLDSLDKAIKAAHKDQEMHEGKTEALSKKPSGTVRQSKPLKKQNESIAIEIHEVNNSVKEEQKSNSKSSIVLQAITTINELQAYKRGLQYKLLQVINFRRQNIRVNGTNTNNLETEKIPEGNGQSVDNIVDTDEIYKEEDFQSSIIWIQEIYNKMKNEIEEKDSVLKHIFDATKLEIVHADQKRGESENNQVLNSKDAKNEVILRYKERLTDLVTRLKEQNKDQVMKLQREIDSFKELNLELQTRMSKLAGMKLTDNNPNITNLGDPNRPMKIGESFSELYDNEWTDAMDLCQKHLGSTGNDDKIIENLYKTLMSCYSICQEKSEVWIKHVKDMFEDVSKQLSNETQEEVFKNVIDSRKLSAEEASDRLLTDVRLLKDKIVKKHLTDIDEKYRVLLLPLPFFANCFKLCWKMVVQTPQMFLQAGPRAGEKFDKNVFREYTSSGSKVVFTVWPALYLHKDGPLLTKGVVKVK